jgi:arylsulfatase A-like enzyme
MSLFTSLAPSGHGVTAGQTTLPGSVITLAQILRAEGYATAAVTEDGPLGVRRGFGRGFDVYKENKSANFMKPEGHVHETLSWGQQWLGQNKGRRFFLFLHTFQVHSPYTPPPEYEALFQEDELSRSYWKGRPGAARMATQYDREIRYVDDEIGKFVGSLLEQDLAHETILVVLSDHGEEFFDHGFHGHGAGLHREVLRVPLIFFGAGLAAGTRVQEPVRHIDLMPTLLELAGAPIPGQVQGASFASLVQSRERDSDEDPIPIFSSSWLAPELKARGARPPSFSVQLGDRKLLRYRTDAGYRYEYYDLSTDPYEMDDLYEVANAEIRELENLLDEFVEANRLLNARLASEAGREAFGSGSELALDPQREEKLRALGYLE